MPCRHRVCILHFLALLRPFRTLLVLCLVLAALGGARAATAGQQAASDPTPSGAQSPAASIDDSRQPLWSFAWLSDMHMGTARPEFIAQALHHVRHVEAPFSC